MERVIASKLAEARMVEAVVEHVPGLALEGVGRGLTSGAGGSMAELFRGRHGLWVGGRATLTTERFLFAADAVNKIVVPGPTEVALELRQVLGVSVSGGFLTRAIAITLPGAELRIRCWGTDEFAAQIRDAVAAARLG